MNVVQHQGKTYLVQSDGRMIELQMQQNQQKKKHHAPAPQVAKKPISVFKKIGFAFFLAVLSYILLSLNSREVMTQRVTKVLAFPIAATVAFLADERK